MSCTEVELCLARLYGDAAALRDFLAQPDSMLAQFALEPQERAALLAMDRAGLVLAGEGFAAKRARAAPPPPLRKR